MMLGVRQLSLPFLPLHVTLGVKPGRVYAMFANCAAIHDLSCYAKSSLTVVSPILEAMGVEACPVPTALLSTQTDGFPDYSFQDLTDDMKDVFAHWNRIGLSFDAVYTGFLGSSRQVSLVSDFIESQRHASHPLVLVDPVLGDGGSPYGPMEDSLIQRMRSLVALADVITPNTTETSLLLGHEWSTTDSVDSVRSRAKALATLGPRRVVITSVSLADSDERCSVAWYDQDREDFGVFSHERVPVSYPGSGDLFASLLCGQLLWGLPFPDAVRQAALWVARAVERTSALGYPYRHGVCPSAVIPDVVSRRPW
jgi:pyridoxine kinase